MIRRTFKYRLYANRQQREKLQATLEVCRELYNAALQERREAWASARINVGYAAQASQLPAIKELREDLRAIHSQVLQDTLRRVDKAFQAFFLRCQRGQKPGFPRFRSKRRYHSFTYPQSGFRLGGGKLSLSKIGNVKIKLHRELKGEVKTLTIKRENGAWYACFSCVVAPEPLPASDLAVGIDVGLTSFAVLRRYTERRDRDRQSSILPAHAKETSPGRAPGRATEEVFQSLEESRRSGREDAPQDLQPTK